MRRAGAGFLALLALNCALAQAGLFNRPCALFLPLSLVIFVVLLLLRLAEAIGNAGILRGVERKRARHLTLGYLALCFGLFLGFYFHPTERILGSSDEGLYTNAAVNLSRTGHYDLAAPLLAQLSAKERTVVLKSEPAEAQRGTKLSQVHPRYHIGLFLRDPDGTRLTPQFPLGWPVVLASFFSAGGFEVMRIADPLLVCTCCLLLSLLALRWLGPVTALCAFTLALFFPLNLWAARSFFSEPAFELVWLLGIYGWAESKKEPFLGGAITGLALGALLFIKIEAFVVLAASTGLLTWHWVDRPKYVVACAAATLLTAGLALLSWMQFNQLYFTDTFGTIRSSVLWAGLAAVAVFAAVLANLEFRRWILKDSAWTRLLKKGAFWGLIGLAFYGAAIRPDTTTPDKYFYWPAQKEIESHREDTFPRLAWYWTPWGLVLASVGGAALVFRTKKPWQVGFFGIGVLFLAGLSYDIRNNPIQPYAMRRFLPFGIPILILGAAEFGRPFVRRFGNAFGNPATAGPVVQVGATLIILAGFIPLNGFINQHGEFAGLHQQLEKLAGQVPANALILTSDGSFLSMAATPLQFMFGRECLSIAPGVFREPGFPALVKRWRASRPVYVLSENGGVRWFDRGHAEIFNPTGYGTIETSYLFQTATDRPSRIFNLKLRYYLIPLAGLD